MWSSGGESLKSRHSVFIEKQLVAMARRAEKVAWSQAFSSDTEEKSPSVEMDLRSSSMSSSWKMIPLVESVRLQVWPGVLMSLSVLSQQCMGGDSLVAGADNGLVVMSLPCLGLLDWLTSHHSVMLSVVDIRHGCSLKAWLVCSMQWQKAAGGSRCAFWETMWMPKKEMLS